MYITNVCDQSVICDKKQSMMVKECFEIIKEDEAEMILKVLLSEQKGDKRADTAKIDATAAAEIMYYAENQKMLPKKQCIGDFKMST
jgi:hypothetical protein